MNRTARIVRLLGLSIAFLAGISQGWCQVRTLPVYMVTQTGAQPAQSAALASFLGVPNNKVSLTNGQITFLDASSFLNVPVLPVTNAMVISNLTTQTINKFPSIPLSFAQLDFGAVNSLAPYSSNAAVTLSSAALANAGLTPSGASPIVGHDILMAVYTNDDNTLLVASNALDTEVDYQFTVPAGYPLIGPGAQVQFNFGTNGSVTRMLYAARQLTAGPMVSLVPANTASNRAAAFYPGLFPQINLQLVYYAPPLSIPTVTAIIPWYLCTGTGMVINPITGGLETIQLTPTLIPATDASAYVPAVSLDASLNPGGTQVNATATITGGTPPYTYSWAGSAPGTATNSGPQINYAPQVQVTPPTLVPMLQAPPTSMGLTWYDPAQFFFLQSSSNLLTGGWSTVTNLVSDNNGQMSVALNIVPGGAQFFRLQQSSPVFPEPETLMFQVSDANGVAARARQNFPSVQVTLSPVRGPTALTPTPGWGVESPYDPGLGTQDRMGWVNSMDIPLFGTFRIYDFDYGALSHDFQSCQNNLYGDYDSTVGTADILLYIGHGNSDGFSFTSPWTQTFLFDSQQHQAWGNNGQYCNDSSPNTEQEWLCLLSCDVLDFTNGAGLDPAARWLPDFNGIHFLLGFHTEAYAETGFPKVFANDMGGGGSPVSIYDAWFDAAKACYTGQAAVLAPVGPNKVCDLGDYWWGQGKVGPNIPASQIKGFCLIYQSY